MKRLMTATTPMHPVRLLAPLMVAAGLGAGAGETAGQELPAWRTTEAGVEVPAAREIAARTGPAVVSIRAMSGGNEVSSGTGFVIRTDGVVVTNFHVVEDGTSLEVELATGEVFTDVYVLGTDERRDLAVLKLPTARLTALEVGDAGALAVGDPVYVMGNPMGLDRTFSDGLVSARRVLDGVAYLQISAPISAGSSGGPVLNAAGRVVGVATASMGEGQNLNLAVPMSYAEGLLSVAGAPERFETVAARWSSSGAGRGAGQPARESAERSRGEPDVSDVSDVSDLSDLQPWQAVVVRQLRSAETQMAEAGYARYDSPRYDLLAVDSLDTALTELPAGDYRALAVCDADCSDVDLMVTDRRGDVLGMDVLEDDVPIVDFRTAGGRVGLAVKMIVCSTDVCYYGMQLFRRVP